MALLKTLGKGQLLKWRLERGVDFTGISSNLGGNGIVTWTLNFNDRLLEIYKCFPKEFLLEDQIPLTVIGAEALSGDSKENISHKITLTSHYSINYKNKTQNDIKFSFKSIGGGNDWLKSNTQFIDIFVIQNTW